VAQNIQVESRGAHPEDKCEVQLLLPREMKTGKQGRLHVHLLAPCQDLHSLVAAGAGRHANIQSVQSAGKVPRFLNFQAKVYYLLPGQSDCIVVSQVVHHDFLVDSGEICEIGQVTVLVVIVEKLRMSDSVFCDLADLSGLVPADLRLCEMAEPVFAEEEEQEETPGFETVQSAEYGREHPFHQNRSLALPLPDSINANIGIHQGHCQWLPGEDLNTRMSS